MMHAEYVSERSGYIPESREPISIVQQSPWTVNLGVVFCIRVHGYV